MKYITTPIYYVNDVAHLGHAYTSIIADMLARFYRLRGDGSYFLTGTDEHGQKIEEAAKAKHKDTKAYCDEISASFKSLWDELSLSYDRFIRTSEPSHIECVQAVFKKMYDSGDIYKGIYEGPYCVSCESFFTKAQLVNEACPDCFKPVKTLKEESYFFKLSKYEKPLLKWLEEAKPITPANKSHEIENFIKKGLKDLSITRTSFSWGIKLPKELNDDKHVVYVWLDALLNYISALNYTKENNKMKELWPAAIHIVGKDILRFHALYWPAFLMSLKLELPLKIATHGWWVVNGEKMSKSKGNVISPKELNDRYSTDVFRYFLLSEIQFGKDGDFNESALIAKLNSKLCNELGNLLNRVIAMSAKYSDLEIDDKHIKKYFEEELSRVNKLIKESLEQIENININKYIENIFELLALANLSITKYEPWVLIKSEREKALALIALCANILVKASILLSPVLIKKAPLIAKAFGVEINTKSYDFYIKDEKTASFKGQKCELLFQKMQDLATEKKENLAKTPEKNEQNSIDLEYFKKIEIKVATVLECERVEKSDKLLRFILRLDKNSHIQVISGLAKYYDPKSLINTQVCVLANLKKAKIFGLESQGMILSVKDENGLTLISPKAFKSEGSLVC